MNEKVDRNTLSFPDKSNPQSESSNNAAADEMQKITTEIWKEVLNLDAVNIQDNFMELGGNSLLATRVLAAVKRATGMRLSFNVLSENPTVEKFAKALLEIKEGLSKPRYLVTLKKGSGKMPLYLVGGIRGNLNKFQKFSEMLDEEQPVFGLRKPVYYDNLDEFSYSLEETAAKYIADILQHNPDGPYALSGYSQGGMVAFEMAKQLEAKGKKVVFLAMYDSIVRKSKKDRIAAKAAPIASKIKKFVMNMYLKADWNFYLMKYEYDHWVQSKRKQLLRFRKKANKINKPSPQESQLKSFKKTMFDTAKAAQGNYKLSPIDKEIVLFRAKRRPVYMDDPTYLGWKPYAKSIKIYEIEGGHGYIFNPKHCKPFASLVQQCLDKCEG